MLESPTQRNTVGPGGNGAMGPRRESIVSSGQELRKLVELRLADSVGPQGSRRGLKWVV